MFRDIPSIRFGTTDGRKADVFINDLPAGAIQFYQGTTWTLRPPRSEPGGNPTGHQEGHRAPQSASGGLMK